MRMTAMKMDWLGAFCTQDLRNWEIAGHLQWTHSSRRIFANSVGTSLELRWNIAEASLDLRWNFAGTSLETRWIFAGTSLKLRWNVAGAKNQVRLSIFSMPAFFLRFSWVASSWKRCRLRKGFWLRNLAARANLGRCGCVLSALPGNVLGRFGTWPCSSSGFRLAQTTILTFALM